jgi:tRNA dimethylallyltransferase
MKAAKNKTVIVIAGPTAVGKTAVAIEVAKHFQTEIISADSRQCYKELSIGVARPAVNELKEVQHHFIASHSIHDEISAAGFEQYALEKARSLFGKYDHVVMVGGTGLYIKAFCEGLDRVPPVPENIREDIARNYKQYGIEWLQKEIREKDDEFFKKGEIKNPQRVMRALEVVESTGVSILHFHSGQRKQRDFNIIKIGLELPKEELHKQIYARVNQMIDAGLVDEVKRLLPDKYLNALQTVGYKELFEYLENKISSDTAIELIRKNTRQYAKRQLTWFRKDKEMAWFVPSGIKEIISAISASVKKKMKGD